MSTCFFRRHLRGAKLSVYEFMLVVSKPPERACFAAISRICLETGYARDTVSIALAGLCREGWLEAKGGNRALAKQGGKFQPNRYRVLEHSEWASSHPGLCEVISRDGFLPPRESPVAEESDIPVTGKSDIPVTGKPPHITSKEQQAKDNKNSQGRGRPARLAEPPDGFEAFWQAYPRKVAKAAALKAFAKLEPDPALLSQMLAALEVQKNSASWKKDGGQFIPHAATWLNGRRWEDEIPTGTEGIGQHGNRIKGDPDANRAAVAEGYRRFMERRGETP